MEKPRSHLWLVRIIKMLHTLSGIGITGAIATFIVLHVQSPVAGAPGYPEVRHGINATYRWLAVPSLVVCVLSGLASMIVHRPYWNAPWAWLKASSGTVLVGLTVRMQGVARSLTEPTVLSDRAELAGALLNEWKGLWTLLVVLALNVIVGIWRPRLKSR